jgi:hypothetical protein
MKKLIYGGLFLALLGMGFVSCEKDEVSTDKNKQTNSSKPFNTANENNKDCPECWLAAIAVLGEIVADASLHRGTTDRGRDGMNCGCGQCFGMCWPNNIIGDDALDGDVTDFAISDPVEGNSIIYFLGDLPSHFEQEFGIDNEISIVKNSDTLFTIKKGVYSAHKKDGIIESESHGELNYSGFVNVSTK